MSKAELEKRILKLRKGGMGVLKIGRTLGVGTSLVQRVLDPFQVEVEVGGAPATPAEVQVTQ